MRWSTSARAAVALGVVATAIIVTGGADAANPIPDEGLPSVPFAALPIVSERTEVLAAGVTGINTANDSFPSTNIRVTSFAEIGSTMYVGGKFKQVFVPATGIRHEQPFVAAFDRNTGAWISSFRPTLDGNVWDLHATADGRLIVAGQFTNVNGVANTRGVAMLDPSTGAVDPSWRVSLTLTGSSARPIARTIDIEGDKLYIGGNFTRIRGTDGNTRNAGRIARATLSTGIVDGTFLPDVDGIVFDIDATPDRVYVVGNFFYVDGVWSIGMAALEPADAKRVPGLKPWVRTAVDTPTASYQQAILAIGDEVWQGGSQHNRQVYRKSDYQLVRSWVSHPWGDAQAFAHLNGIVYSGSHANGQTRLYRDAYRWPELTGATSSKPARWMEAFDTNFHEHLTWYPDVGTHHGEGAWALFADSTDCLWAGGDFNRGSYDGNVSRFVGGFAKFCTQDDAAPTTPTNPQATVSGGGVDLTWSASRDDRGGRVTYDVFKNDRAVAASVSATSFRDPSGNASDRYFVRATDTTGNASATTGVITAA